MQKQHAEAFAKPRDTTAAQLWRLWWRICDTAASWNFAMADHRTPQLYCVILYNRQRPYASRAST